eukprot:GHVP01024754.1.p1 GENE.GHVP01024754.1~~GHVP01024754.1.p1  ORF type:complete len:1241 (+),score=269.22 GHVP01024754.1:111-3833(+)
MESSSVKNIPPGQPDGALEKCVSSLAGFMADQTILHGLKQKECQSSQQADIMVKAQHATQCFRYIQNDLMPPQKLLRKAVKHLSKDEQQRLEEFPQRFIRMLAGEENEEDLEEHISNRRSLLEAVLDPVRYNTVCHYVSFTPEVLKRVEVERRLLSLRELQKQLRSKLLEEASNQTSKVFQDFVLRPQSYADHTLESKIWKKRVHGKKPKKRKRTKRFTQEDILVTGPPKQKIPKVFDVEQKKIAGIVTSLSRSLQESQKAKKWMSDPESAAKLKWRQCVESLENMHGVWIEGWKSRKAVCKVLSATSRSIGLAVETRKKTLEEKEKTERLKMLKSHNFDEYVKIVRKTANERLNELLDQTDRFLQDLEVKVADQKKASKSSSSKSPISQRKRSLAAEKLEPPKQTSTLGVPPSSPVLAPVVNDQAVDEDQPCGTPGQTAKAKAKVQPSPLVQETFLSLSHSVAESVTQPICLTGGVLLPYQIEGLQFMVSLFNNALSGILADEMGLGKTIQTIALFAFLREMKEVKGPHLIIVPLSTLPNWAAEFRKWCPDIHVIKFKGTKDERKVMAYEIRKKRFDCILTTYDYIMREQSLLSGVRWKYIVVDEGHRMKNSKSKLHTVLHSFTSSHRLLLTGTPLQNNISELWSLLNFLLPHIFHSSVDFERWFNEPFKNLPSSEKDMEIGEEEQLLVINRLHMVLRPFLLRRIKTDVLKDLPGKREYVVRIPLTHWQKKAYEAISNKCFLQTDAEGKVSRKAAQNVMMQLRKITNHPYIFLDEYEIDEDIFRTSGKFELLDRMLSKLLMTDHKVLIFSQMTSVLDLLAYAFDLRSIKYLRLDGSTSEEDRKDRMELFNTKGSDSNVFMLSTRAGGLGLNLQAADTVIIFDSDWNPHQDMQAQARAHRMGQTSEVRVFRLVTLSGIEKSIMDKATHKMDIDEKVIQAGMFNAKSSEEERVSKLRDLVANPESLNEETRLTTPMELNRYLARTEEEEFLFRDHDRKLFFNHRESEGSVVSQCTSEMSEFILDGAEADATESRSSVGGQGEEAERNQLKEMNYKTEKLLIDSGRLMKEDEVPADVLLDTEYVEEVDLELDRGSRKSRTSLGIIASSDNLSESAFLRTLDRYESGEAKDFASALTMEKKLQAERQNRKMKPTEAKSPKSEDKNQRSSTQQKIVQNSKPSEPSRRSTPAKPTKPVENLVVRKRRITRSDFAPSTPTEKAPPSKIQKTSGQPGRPVRRNTKLS